MWNEFIDQSLADWKARNLERWLTVNASEAPNFCSNDYLGFSHHPVLQEAARTAIDQHGVGSGASRYICGNTSIQNDLDTAVACFKGTEAALSFSSGYAAALGTIPALMKKGDTIILDKLSHASLVDAARLSGATVRVFPHNHLEYMEKLLQRPRPGKTLIVTESVFSMDGDHALLTDVVRLKEQYGAWLMVDEAHATGCFGARRSGLIEELGLSGSVEIQMGTFSKGLGSSGGYIAGGKRMIDYLIQSARSLIYSTAPSPVTSAVNLAAIRLVQSEEGRQAAERLWSNVDLFSKKQDLSQRNPSPIFPIIYGSEEKALAASLCLKEKGYSVPAIRFPTVPKGQARLRVTLNARLTPDAITAFAEVL